jgi:hypothetical protein
MTLAATPRWQSATTPVVIAAAALLAAIAGCGGSEADQTQPSRADATGTTDFSPADLLADPRNQAEYVAGIVLAAGSQLTRPADVISARCRPSTPPLFQCAAQILPAGAGTAFEEPFWFVAEYDPERDLETVRLHASGPEPCLQSLSPAECLMIVRQSPHVFPEPDDAPSADTNPDGDGPSPDETTTPTESFADCDDVPGAGLKGSDIVEIVALEVDCETAQEIATEFMADDPIAADQIEVSGFQCSIGPMTEGYPSSCSGPTGEQITFRIE